MLTRGWSIPSPTLPTPKSQRIQAACALGHRPPGGFKDSLLLHLVHLSPFLQLTSLFKKKENGNSNFDSLVFLCQRCLPDLLSSFPLGGCFYGPLGAFGPHTVFSQGSLPSESKGNPIPGKSLSAQAHHEEEHGLCLWGAWV